MEREKQKKLEKERMEQQRSQLSKKEKKATEDAEGGDGPRLPQRSKFVSRNPWHQTPCDGIYVKSLSKYIGILACRELLMFLRWFSLKYIRDYGFMYVLLRVE